MPNKTVFISSTYVDLKEYRRAVWDALKKFDVAVRGMEEFGARTAGPLETCLAEVEESDVYVGILGYRLGSVDSESKRPFTVLEYERAAEQEKEILIYMADDEAASFPQTVVDQDSRSRKRLEAFKRKLRERHTVDTFTTPDDLTEKLARDFKKHFVPKESAVRVSIDEDVYAKTAALLKAFRLTPKRYNGHEVRLGVSFYGTVFPASRALCRRFNLDYGFTVGAHLRITEPNDKNVTAGYREIYAVGNTVDTFISLFEAKKVDLYAQLQFAEEDVKGVAAEFFGTSYFDDDNDYYGDPREVYVPPEGKVILLFRKKA